MYNPHLQKQEPRKKDANYYFTRKDEFPHPLRRVVFHINGTVNKPIEKVVYEIKEEAAFWRDTHIDDLPANEWFKTPQEAVDARNNGLKKAKAAKEKVDAEVAKAAKEAAKTENEKK